MDPKNLILQDTITELDLFQPLPDPDDLLRDDNFRFPGQDPTLLDFGTSQLLPDSQTPRKNERRMLLDDDDDLGLDLGLGPSELTMDRSIEVGRRAPTPRRDDPTLLNFDDDLGLDLGFGDTTIGGETSNHPVALDDDVTMLNIDDELTLGTANADIEEANATALARADAARDRKVRSSISPLSSIRSSAERDLEQSYQQSQVLQDDEIDATNVQAAQRVKRRKVMSQDTETELQNHQIRKQQQDTSAITKAPSFLPRDPLLLQLMEMQRNGSFVSNIMGDGRLQGWAPELRGILSMEVIRSAGEKKRKRDSGVADLGTDGERQETPRLELPEEELDEGFGGAGGDFGRDTTLRSDGLAPVSDGLAVTEQREEDDDDEQYLADSPAAPFDTTEAPLLHPADSGPVSLGTKNAVHLLREQFAPGHAATSTAPPTPSKRVKAEVMFTDLCPEARTSRPDATKMFFELLVLGTKDAIKVEQESSDLGLPIRVRGKRGLWGDWAETSASQLQAQTQDVAVEV
nr:cohesin subunit rad21 [Quercus suber]